VLTGNRCRSTKLKTCRTDPRSGIDGRRHRAGSAAPDPSFGIVLRHELGGSWVGCWASPESSRAMGGIITGCLPRAAAENQSALQPRMWTIGSGAVGLPSRRAVGPKSACRRKLVRHRDAVRLRGGWFSVADAWVLADRPNTHWRRGRSERFDLDRGAGGCLATSVFMNVGCARYLAFARGVALRSGRDLIFLAYGAKQAGSPRLGSCRLKKNRAAAGAPPSTGQAFTPVMSSLIRSTEKGGAALGDVPAGAQLSWRQKDPCCRRSASEPRRGSCGFAGAGCRPPSGVFISPGRMTMARMPYGRGVLVGRALGEKADHRPTSFGGL